EYYAWNSNYPDRFTKSLKANLHNPSHIQDVTHGNHELNYIITAVNLQTGTWNKKDLERFSNTIKYSVWNENSLSFSDYVDGTNSSSKELKNTGWKQSDGWMKLIDYDPDLLHIYSEYFQKNTKMIQHSSLGLQYIA